MKLVADVWFRSDERWLEDRIRGVEIEVEGGLVQDLAWRGRRWRYSHKQVAESPEGELVRWFVFRDKGPTEESER